MPDRSLVLVTGGAGFIGSHLVEALAADGVEVRAFDNLSSGRAENLAGVRGRVDLIVGDVRSEAQLAAAMDGVGVVVHLAALVSVADSVERPAENYEINVMGTVRVLEAARAAGVRRVVCASSAAVYGNEPTLPKREDMPPVPASPYAAAKLAGEQIARVHAELYGLGTVSLRFFNVYGPRQDPSSPYSGVISRFVEALARGEPPRVFGDGRQTRDFVFVRDVVAAIRRAADSPAVGRGEVFNVGTGRASSLLEVLGVLGPLAGHSPAPRFEPPRPGDVRHSVADISRIREVLGFEPGVTLADGLAELWRGRVAAAAGGVR
ncbi:MAG: NAD-dependent epimerase/dehydratase family protein [Kiritimatiellae bacterium]|nr:NAD-dependent epimerase/dehydratase family protein [Kiritimatiellia bacterium]